MRCATDYQQGRFAWRMLGEVSNYLKEHDMKKELLAYPYGTYGLYRIKAQRTIDTYNIKDKIKSYGGQWDGDIKAWIIPESAIEQLGIIKMILVKHDAHCHESAGQCYAPEYDVKRGYMKMGCGYCDTPYICGKDVKITVI